MSLRERLQAAIARSDLAEVESIVATKPQAVRFLLGLSYQQDDALSGAAAQGIGLAAKYHPQLIQSVVRRLVWAMNDESGTNAETAPRVIEEIAKQRPELLVPMVPDLIRLAADINLYDGLANALQMITEGCPGEVGRGLALSLEKKLRLGERREGGENH